MLKKNSKILVALFLILALVSSFSFATVEPRTVEEDEASNVVLDETTATISDDETSTDEDATSSENSWVNNDLFISEDTVNVSDVVDGNAFICGKDVTISGEIGGDLFVVADKLTISGGYVYSSIFACANEITINGVVYDLYAICNSFTLGTDGYIYRDMKLNSNTASIEGKVRRNAFINANNLKISESNGTLISGNLNYTSSSEITIPDDIVTGDVNYTAAKAAESKSIGSIIATYILDLVKTLIFTFIVTLLVLWMAPKFKEKVCSMNVAKSFISLGIGFATPIAIAIASIILLFTVVCVPVSFEALFVLALLYTISFSVASIFFGGLFTKILKMEGKVKFVLFTLVSALVLWILSQIPFIGGFIGFLIATFGLGATVVNIFYKKDSTKKEENK